MQFYKKRRLQMNSSLFIFEDKIKRIKAAFASQFQDKLACHYYITGRAGEPKRITLDRSLVEDKSGLILKR